MPKRIVVVNAGPRRGWNTDTLVTEAARGAVDAGAQAERFDLFKLERYTGCTSCFGCKKDKFKGRCICRDGLTPVLDAIRAADGLIIGSPNYLGGAHGVVSRAVRAACVPAPHIQRPAALHQRCIAFPCCLS